MLSVIIPSYNEELNVLNTAKVLSALFKENSIETELIFIDDGSKDKSGEPKAHRFFVRMRTGSFLHFSGSVRCGREPQS